MLWDFFQCDGTITKINAKFSKDILTKIVHLNKSTAEKIKICEGDLVVKLYLLLNSL